MARAINSCILILSSDRVEVAYWKQTCIIVVATELNFFASLGLEFFKRKDIDGGNFDELE